MQSGDDNLSQVEFTLMGFVWKETRFVPMTLFFYSAVRGYKGL